MSRGRASWRALLMVLVLATTAGGAEAQSHSEYEIKAAFLINFAKFVRWSDELESTGWNEGRSLEFCVLGDDPFGPALDGLEGQEVANRVVRVRRSAAVQDLGACNVLFVARSEQDRFTEILSGLERRPVLTVGDAGGFAESGGMINFVIEGNNLRFTINLEAVAASGLDVSSRLLRLAVRDDGSD